MQQRVVLAQLRDARRQRGVLRQRLFERRLPRGGQLAVHIGVDVGVGDGQGIHDGDGYLTIFSDDEALGPSAKAARSFSRARDRRDITVPTGMASVDAMSS